MPNIAALITVAAVMFAVLGAITLIAHIYNLNNIKSKTVGDGQHGTARWANKAEIRKTYRHIPFTPKKWRKQAKQNQIPTMTATAPRKLLRKKTEPTEEALPQGIVVGCKGGKHSTTALIDTGDVHVLMIGAAGVGKTAFWLYPCIEYACASGMSFLSTDTKGDVMRNYGNIAKDYGYCYKNGIIAIESKESKVLKLIFSAYLNGDSMLTIAEQLNREKIEYASGVIGWNKGRLKHLIDNPRYLGTEVYPQIIEQATYEKIQKTKHSRNTQKDTDKAQEIFRLTVPVRCPICGSLMRRRHDSRCKCQERWTCENKECRLRIEISDAELLTALSDLLSTVTADSISLPAEKPYEPSTEAIRLNNEISRMLDAAEIDKAILRNKMTECISQKYSELGNECCTAHKLKAELGSLFDVTERLNRTVSEIRLHPDKTADLILLNGQIIRKEKIHATDSGRSTEGGAGNRTDHIGQGEHQKPLSSLACCSILPSFHEARGTTQQL